MKPWPDRAGRQSRCRAGFVRKHSNRAAAADWGCEVVAIPDEIHSLGGLDETVDDLASRGVRLRIDPILEPIGFGFAAASAAICKSASVTRTPI